MIQIVPCANCGHDLHHVAEPHRCQTPGCDCPGLPGRDWPAFWSTLTDAEAAACLRAAPRVAGEWEESLDVMAADLVYTREDTPGHCVAWYYQRPEGWRWVAEMEGGIVATAALARAACDSALRASGWRVIG